MKKRQTKKATGPTVVLNEWRRRPDFDPVKVEPDALRDQIRKALFQLSDDERAGVSGRLVAALKQAGIRIGQCLLLLGIPARTADEITPSEIATLIRYVRISEPNAMTALAPILRELMTSEAEPAKVLRFSSHAA